MGRAIFVAIFDAFILTMVAVDTIYGLSMPEQGVSAVTPVDFRALGHEAMVFEAG